MAVREIKTTIALDGEKAFEAELRAISKEMRVTNSELKVLRSEFDITDDKMGNLTRQSQLVKEKLDQQTNVVAALELEVRDAARAYGEASEEVQDLTMKLNSARVSMNSMEKESMQIDREIEELGRDSERAGRQIRDGIGDAAEETSKDLQGMANTFSDELGGIRDMLSWDFAVNLASGAWDLATGLAGFAESTRDYNRQMSYLENNARQAGFSIDFIKEKFFDVASVTGEADGAIEGLSNLLLTGFDSTEMEKAILGIIGAVTQWPDTLKFESLADSIQETLATGSATGQYAELLERMGINLDEFNAAMAAATTEEGRQQIVLATLTGGLTDAGNAYQDMNQDLIDAEKSSMNLNDAMSGLGRTIDTWFTPGRNAAADVIRGINDALNDTNFTLLDKALSFILLPSTTSPGDLEDAEKYNQGTIEAQKAAGIEMPVIHLNDDQDFVAEINETVSSQESDIQAAGQTAGAALGTGMVSGLAGETDLVVAEISATVDQINGELAQVNPIRLSVNGPTGTSTSASGAINVSLAMDGRTVGRVVAPYVMQTGGKMTEMTNIMHRR